MRFIHPEQAIHQFMEVDVMSMSISNEDLPNSAYSSDSLMDFSLFTPAEHDLMHWLAKGKTVEEAGFILEIKLSTAWSRVSHIRRKCNLLTIRVIAFEYLKTMSSKE
ncbi:hypothetical protein KSF73_08190 [Burkholderiaceae bacterium DAT-1]|nr:hypothetical protein [Burkholderiaceae bacterium DAT-1]